MNDAVDIHVLFFRTHSAVPISDHQPALDTGTASKISGSPPLAPAQDLYPMTSD